MATDPTMTRFDLPAFRTAFEAKDVAAWLSSYTEDAEWVEYRYDAPPRAPHRIDGHAQIGTILTDVAAAGFDLAATNEAIGPGRVTFAVPALLPGGRRVYEHVILRLRDSHTARQVDIEAWD